MPQQPADTGIIIPHFTDEDVRLRKFRLCPPRSIKWAGKREEIKCQKDVPKQDRIRVSSLKRELM